MLSFKLHPLVINSWLNSMEFFKSRLKHESSRNPVLSNTKPFLVSAFSLNCTFCKDRVLCLNYVILYVQGFANVWHIVEAPKCEPIPSHLVWRSESLVYFACSKLLITDMATHPDLGCGYLVFWILRWPIEVVPLFFFLLKQEVWPREWLPAEYLVYVVFAVPSIKYFSQELMA